MKMLREHYDILDDAMKIAMATYPNIMDLCRSDEHWRWTLLSRCVIDGQPYYRFTTKHLHPYLNDAHIDTALRKITGTK